MNQGFFEIFAECAIAFAGFGAVHAALHGAVGPRAVLRAWTVVSQGALCFLLSVLPLLLALASLPDELMWRSASAVGVVGAGTTTWTFWVFDLRYTRMGHLPQARLSIRTAQSCSGLGVLLMLGNLVGWPGSPGPLAYATALVLILLTGLIALLHSFLVPVQLVLHGTADGALRSSADD